MRTQTAVSKKQKNTSFSNNCINCNFKFDWCWSSLRKATYPESENWVIQQRQHCMLHEYMHKLMTLCYNG